MLLVYRVHANVLLLDRFRWAFCQLQELKKLKGTKPKYIKETLQNLPATLDAASVQVTIGVVNIDDDPAGKLALSEEEVRVIDVACMLKDDADAKEEESERKEEEAHPKRSLKRRLVALESTKALYGHAVNTLTQFATTLDAAAKRRRVGQSAGSVQNDSACADGVGGPDGGAGVAQLDAYLDRLLSRGGDAVAAAERIDEEIAEVEEKMRKEGRLADRRKELPNIH